MHLYLQISIMKEIRQVLVQYFLSTYCSEAQRQHYSLVNALKHPYLKHCTQSFQTRAFGSPIPQSLNHQTINCNLKNTIIPQTHAAETSSNKDRRKLRAVHAGNQANANEVL